MRWALLIICIVTFTNCENEISDTAERGILLDWFTEVFGANVTNNAYNDILPEDDITLPNTGKPPRCRYCKCGIPRNDSRIINGEEAKKYVYSWMGSLLKNNNHTCGVSLINDLYGLTAAHCVYRLNKSELKVRFNLHNQLKPVYAVDLLIEQIIMHQNYQPAIFNNDIALLKFARRFDLSDQSKAGKLKTIRPICLTRPNVSYVGRNVTIIGWGFTTETGDVSEVLRQVTVPVITQEKCQEVYPNAKITDKMLCAGYKDGMYDSCEGDSGSPLMLYENEPMSYEQIGIVSWGVGCARPEHPGVHTDVSQFISWIYDNTEDACYCGRP